MLMLIYPYAQSKEVTPRTLRGLRCTVLLGALALAGAGVWAQAVAPAPALAPTPAASPAPAPVAQPQMVQPASAPTGARRLQLREAVINQGQGASARPLSADERAYMRTQLRDWGRPAAAVPPRPATPPGALPPAPPTAPKPPEK